MKQIFEEIASLDHLIHEPARLALLTALSACEKADFLYLQRLTGLTKGNLSAHLAKLEQAGLVRVEKGFSGKIPRTQLALTKRGQGAIESHWQTLDDLRKDARQWKPVDQDAVAPTNTEGA
jgi:DNA-binding MarR family transcriptional regulator